MKLLGQARMSRGGKLCRVFGAQIVLFLFAALVSEPWSLLCGYCALYLPFVGYIVVLYNFPILTTLSPAFRMACLTIISIFATVAGLFVIILLDGPTD